MNKEEMKQILFGSLDLIQSRIDKSTKPLSEKIAKLEKKLQTIEEYLEQEQYNE